MTDARNFLVNTDYPIDKIILMDSGSVTLAAGGSDTDTITHGLDDLPLIKGIWSFDSDFSTCFDMGFMLYADANSVYALCSSNATDYTISTFNNDSVSHTVYWRVYGVAEESSTEDFDSTSSTADNFVLNTDYNYTKLHMSGTVDTSSSSQNVVHGLGYIPQVDVWFESSSTPNEYVHWNLGSSDYSGLYDSVKITTNLLSFVRGSTPTSDSFKYRIYIDD